MRTILDFEDESLFEGGLRFCHHLHLRLVAVLWRGVALCGGTVAWCGVAWCGVV